MNERLQTQLSAYLDGELSASEHAKLTEKMAADAVLRKQLASYQRMSDLIQADGVPEVDASGVASAVSQRLIDEPVIIAPRAKRPINVPRIAFGAALAATVAMITVNVAPQFLSTDDDTGSPQTFAFAPKLSTPNFSIANVALQSGQDEPVAAQHIEQRWKILKPRVQKQLDRYLVEHSEYSGHIGVAGPNAHIGFVSRKNAR